VKDDDSFRARSHSRLCKRTVTGGVFSLEGEYISLFEAMAGPAFVQVPTKCPGLGLSERRWSYAEGQPIFGL
jgi:hypothetical protein